MFPVSDSANTSRTISRMSEEGESCGQDKCTEAGGRHSKETVSQLVTKVIGDTWTSNDMDCGIMIMTLPR